MKKLSDRGRDELYSAARQMTEAVRETARATTEPLLAFGRELREGKSKFGRGYRLMVAKENSPDPSEAQAAKEFAELHAETPLNRILPLLPELFSRPRRKARVRERPGRPSAAEGAKTFAASDRVNLLEFEDTYRRFPRDYAEWTQLARQAGGQDSEHEKPESTIKRLQRAGRNLRREREKNPR